MKRFSLVLIGVLFIRLISGTSTYGQCKLNLSGYQLVWQEEFNSLSSAKQNFDLFSRNSWTAHYEYYDQSQVNIANGICTLKASKLPAPVTYYFNDGTSKIVGYKSGMLSSKNGPDQSSSWCPECKIGYGILEIRAKIPKGRTNPPYSDATVWDTWPAIWLYSGPGEIDLLDNTAANSNMQVMSGAIRWEAFPGYAGSGWTFLGSETLYPAYDSANYCFSTTTAYPANAIVWYNHRVYKATSPTKIASSG